jgi:hypothetical protein
MNQLQTEMGISQDYRRSGQGLILQAVIVFFQLFWRAGRNDKMFIFTKAFIFLHDTTKI